MDKVPRGVEVLIKKAAVDEAFRERLLSERAQAAALIGLKLAPAEEALLANIPAAQLAATISRTVVKPDLRRVFLAGAAAAMLAACAATSCGDPAGPVPVSEGIRPDTPSPSPFHQESISGDTQAKE
jgi:hypothetical protein